MVLHTIQLRMITDGALNAQYTILLMSLRTEDITLQQLHHQEVQSFQPT
jgi:hypothetical protein